MKSVQIIQFVVAIALIVVILLQNRGAGLSGLFGGTSNIYLTKRGLEKKLFTMTIVLAVAFFAVSLLGVVL